MKFGDDSGYLQSTNHHCKHSGYGQSAIGGVVSDKITSVPEQKSVTAENNKVSSAQSHTLGESTLVTYLLRNLQCGGVSLQCSWFAHECKNNSNLNYCLHVTSRIDSSQMREGTKIFRTSSFGKNSSLPVRQYSRLLKELPGSWQRAWLLWWCRCRRLRQSKEPPQELPTPIATRQWNPQRIRTQKLPYSGWSCPAANFIHSYFHWASRRGFRNREITENRVCFFVLFPFLSSHLLTNGVLDHHCISVDGENDVRCSHLCIKILNVLVQCRL